MRTKLKSATACVLTLLTLSGCGIFGSKPEPVVQSTQLAAIPPDIRACFRQEVAAPQGVELTSQVVFSLIGDFKKSERKKNKCGQRLINFYDAQAGALK